jgi:hypothetical protein
MVFDLVYRPLVREAVFWVPGEKRHFVTNRGSLFNFNRTSSNLLRHGQSFVKASFLAFPRSYPSFLGYVPNLRFARLRSVRLENYYEGGNYHSH